MGDDTVGLLLVILGLYPESMFHSVLGRQRRWPRFGAVQVGLCPVDSYGGNVVCM